MEYPDIDKIRPDRNVGVLGFFSALMGVPALSVGLACKIEFLTYGIVFGALSLWALKYAFDHNEVMGEILVYYSKLERAMIYLAAFGYVSELLVALFYGCESLMLLWPLLLMVVLSFYPTKRLRTPESESMPLS